MISLTVDGNDIKLKEGITAAEYVRENGLAGSVLALKVNNEIAQPERVLQNGDNVSSLTIATDEGYLIYKESLILVLLYAAELIYGCEPVYVRQSVNKSTYFEIRGDEREKSAIASQLREKMRDIIASDEKIEQLTVRRDEAARIFAACSMEERAAEISALPSDWVKLCKTADRYHLTYQSPAYSIKSVSNFDITPYDDGFLLRYPTNYTKTEIPPMRTGRKIHRAVEEYRDWITTIGAGDIFALNKYVREGRAAELVNLSEGLHEKRISKIADDIKNNKDIKIILIAGPSSSGKTTFANRLCLHLRINHLEPVVLSLDNYFVDDEHMPRDSKGEMDYDHVDTIDRELFNDHLTRLAAGEAVTVPRYDFNLRRRVDGATIRLSEGNVIIAEGIHALNELLTSGVPKKNKYKIYLSALTSLCLDEYNAFSPTDNRLLRRIVRDAAYRNTSADLTLALWKNVRKGEQKYIFPFEDEADEVFNSSLVYELSVLKKPAEALLATVPKTSPHFSRAARLAELLSYFEPLDPSPVPPTSIIREFIGGSTVVQ